MTDPAPQVSIETAETVNLPAQGTHLPYVKVIAGVSFIILAAYAGITIYILLAGAEKGIDAATKGAVINTWNNLAVMAATFWVGSSLAGKMTTGRAAT